MISNDAIFLVAHQAVYKKICAEGGIYPMGKGDKKSKKGKIFRGSHGKTRPKKRVKEKKK